MDCSCTVVGLDFSLYEVMSLHDRDGYIYIYRCLMKVVFLTAACFDPLSSDVVY